MQKMNRKICTYIGAAMTVLVTFSCSLPKTSLPNVALPPSYHKQELAADTSIATVNYRDFFKDPVLIKLIDEAMLRNNDLQVALLQIDIASQGFKQAKWLNIPMVNASIAAANINRPSDNSMNGMMASQFMGKSYMTDYTTAVNFSWELDLWAKLKGQKQDALLALLQSKEAVNGIKTKLVTEVVQGYYNLLMLDKQLEISKANLAFADSSLNLLTIQYNLGVATSIAVQQQALIKEQILKSIPAIEGSIAVQENALHVLIGRFPDVIERQQGLDDIYVPTQLASGIPAMLLSNRPDIRASELEVRKSQVGVHIARASMYPVVNITAQGGLNAFKASNWFNIPGSLFGMAAGAIAQPLLDGRQLKTRLEQSKLAAEQAELQFKQSVLVGVVEVSDALTQIQKLEQQQHSAARIRDQSQELVHKSMVLYEFSGASYLEVIVAQTNKLQAEIDLATMKAQKLNAIAVLYRSLGGGWQ